MATSSLRSLFDRRSLALTVSWERVTRIATVLLALTFLLTYFGMAWLRVPYPFALEWVESGMLGGVRQLLAGGPLYAEPRLEYIAFNYPPFYTYVSALAARFLGAELPTLRLVSFACSLGCLGLIGWLVWKETRDRTAAFLAAGLFAATYELTAVWFDLARADSLHVLLLLAGFAWLRHDRHEARGAVLSAVLFGLSFLAKQSGLTSTAPLVAFLLVTRPRQGVWFATTFAAVILGSTLAFDAMSNGWYRYYVFGIPRSADAHMNWLPYFWIHDAGRIGFALAVGLAFVVLSPAGARSRPALLYAAWMAGLVFSTWWVRLYFGAGENNVMPVTAGAAVLFGLGWHEVVARCRAAGAHAAWGPLFHAACLLQFLGLGYFPPKFVPRASDRAAGMALVEKLRAMPGDVMVPLQPHIAELAGKSRHYHGMALAAVTIVGKGEAAVQANALVDRLIAEQHFTAIVLDDSFRRMGETTPGYALTETLFDDPGVFWTKSGAPSRPQLVFRASRLGRSEEHNESGANAR